tara:strand:- start:134 stop:913 length:780 start_codon:yes stop_codon:yes gene_type:complete
MGKTLVQRSKEEATGSPAVWLCVYKAIKHVKHLEACRRSHHKNKSVNNANAAEGKRVRRSEAGSSLAMQEQSYRERKRSGEFVPKQRKRGVNTEAEKANAKRLREENPERAKSHSRKYYEKNKKAVITRSNARAKKHRGTGSTAAIAELCRNRVNDALRLKSVDKTSKSLSLLGCSVKEYQEYLGVTDLTNLKDRGVEIDHIWPVAAYNLSDPAEQFRAFNYQNTRICNRSENREKSSQLPTVTLMKLVPRHLWPLQYQ